MLRASALLTLIVTLTTCTAPPRKPAAEMPAWALIDGKHWQKRPDGPTSTPEEVDRAEGTGGCTHAGQVRVAGKMKRGSSEQLELLQNQTCTNWISRDFPARCATFDRARWLELSNQLSTKNMSFCMDRYEYPNVRGAYPLILINWHEARALCEKQGKRLCTDEEWTFACEGEEASPYPYGYERSSEKCNADRGWTQYDGSKFRDRASDACRDELARLWRGLPSGSQPECRGQFPIYDLTGNVDEWTVRKISSGKFKTAMKGGYWGPVRARCRPATTVHDEGHVFYQQGFRCCADR